MSKKRQVDDVGSISIQIKKKRSKVDAHSGNERILGAERAPSEVPSGGEDSDRIPGNKDELRRVEANASASLGKSKDTGEKKRKKKHKERQEVMNTTASSLTNAEGHEEVSAEMAAAAKRKRKEQRSLRKQKRRDEKDRLKQSQKRSAELGSSSSAAKASALADVTDTLHDLDEENAAHHQTSVPVYRDIGSPAIQAQRVFPNHKITTPDSEESNGRKRPSNEVDAPMELQKKGRKDSRTHALSLPQADIRTMPLPASVQAKAPRKAKKGVKATNNPKSTRDVAGEAQKSANPSTPSITALQPAKRAKTKSVQDQIDEALANSLAGSSRRGTSNRLDREGQPSLKSKEGLLLDAETLTHKEMLVNRLYHAFQLKWLQEERGLQVKTGKFSLWEQERMTAVINAFKDEHAMSDDDFVAWMFAKNTEADKNDLYTSFWREVTSCIEDRANRSVRIFIRRKYQAKGRSGQWSVEEQEELEKAVEEHGENWSVVSRELADRTPEACRLRWRDHRPNLKGIAVKGHFTEEQTSQLREAVLNVCQEKGLDATSPTAKVPWQLVSERIDGARRPGSCHDKWQLMLASMRTNDDISLQKQTWSKEDTRIFIERLGKQAHALQKDDFTEVKLSSLKSVDWMKDVDKMLKHWRTLVRRYVTRDENAYKLSFRDNLAKVKEAFDSGQKVRKRHGEILDTIDSDEDAK
ncbi:hypothetical protein CBS101457_000975 [Exobasidium rhododendri]|nr:hypothetical protein CBS101457_000975 [Exobasidium rhododendri]